MVLRGARKSITAVLSIPFNEPISVLIKVETFFQKQNDSFLPPPFVAPCPIIPGCCVFVSIITLHI